VSSLVQYVSEGCTGSVCRTAYTRRPDSLLARPNISCLQPSASLKLSPLLYHETQVTATNLADGHTVGLLQEDP
jgi:hypothetical protein